MISTRTKKVKTRTIVLCAIAACTLLSYALLPEVLSVSWRFLHGNSVRFGAWEVPVPWGWYREINGKDAIDLQRAERWSPSEYPSSDLIIGDLNLPAGAEFDIEKWKRGSIKDSTESGYRFPSINTAQLDNEVSTCVTVSERDHADRLWIHCVFPVHRLDIQYMGTKTHSQGLDFIIYNMKNMKPST